MAFSGFPDDTLPFLEDLRMHNSKEWFDANRARYDEAFIAAGKRFVEDMAPVLAKISPDIEAQPKVNGSIFRINRDTRFSKDKTPYKDHLDFWFWEGQRKGAVSGFFARVSPDEFGVGVGAHGLDKDGLAAFRSAVDDPSSGKALAEAAAKVEKAGFTLDGEHYKRVPKGFSDDGPAGRFILFAGLHTYTEHDPSILTDGAAVTKACRATWSKLAPIHRWLIDNVQNV
jgi:uncharacterized protein (TIGR02453 family)